MTDGRKTKAVGASGRNVDEALAVLIAGTRRVRRNVSLVDIAAALDVARQEFGSLHTVGEAVGLSEEMLRQFASVDKLTPEARRLVAERRIDSVDVVYRLSRLPPRDQPAVARLVARNKLSSADVRAIVSYRKRAPALSIRQVIERVVGSRNIKEYLIEFLAPSGKGAGLAVRRRFEALLGRQNVRSFKVRGKVGIVVLNTEGKRRLETAASDRRLTKRALVGQLVLSPQRELQP